MLINSSNKNEKIYVCRRCSKKTAQNQIIEQNGKCLCNECVEKIELLSKKLEAVDVIVDEYISSHNLHVMTSFVGQIKAKVKEFLTDYIRNSESNYAFCWSEYPMGAIHCKMLMKRDGVWCIVQDDYDRNPREITTPYPKINDENIAEYLTKFIIEEGN